MIYRTDIRNSKEDSRLKLWNILLSWLEAYAQIYFAKRMLPGLLFLLATFVSPFHGLSGIMGLVSANLWARLLGRPEEQIAEGYYGFNGLLVALALGLFYRFSVPFVVLTLLATFLTVIIAAALRNISERYIGLPVLSAPFVLVTWLSLLASFRFSALEWRLEGAYVSMVSLDLLPELVRTYLSSLGAAFFQTGVLSGLLVFLGLLVHSRWSVLLSFIGFASGYFVYVGLGGAPSDLSTNFVGFNFILTAIAVGGVWIVLKSASLVFAVAGGAASALLSAALMVLLDIFRLPILASPFILTTQMLLFVVMIRKSQGPLKIVQSDWDSPEHNLNRALSRELRYPDPTVPVVYLPVMGSWVVTQGMDGPTTHQGLWSEAWDLQVVDDEGRLFHGEGARLEDHYAYGAPVLAPGEGKVVRVVSHLDDQPLGEVDTSNNWGNLVILWHQGEVYSALCHLQKGSITVSEGETVTAGQVIGRVGNSGRSPEPHLHFQIQGSWEIGAPTRFSEFLHYIKETGETREYVTHGVPESEQIISPVEISDPVRRAVTLAPGREWSWIIDESNSRRVEHWISEIDPIGTRRITAQNGKASATFFVDKHYATMLDYDGAARALLGLFYLAAARVPFIDDPKVSWTDAPSSTPFMSLAKRTIHDLMLPFHPISPVRTRSTISRSNGNIKLVTQFENGSLLTPKRRIPDRIEILFAVGVGPTSIRAFRKDEQILSAELQS